MSRHARHSDVPHYRFSTQRTNGGLVLLIQPIDDGGRVLDDQCRLYAFTPDEVRGLIACLDILPDPVPE